MKDTVVVPRFGRAVVEFVADQPGLTLFHCHIQQHMDYGFKALLRYGCAVQRAEAVCHSRRAAASGCAEGAGAAATEGAQKVRGRRLDRSQIALDHTSASLDALE
jgi:hypothetical protein